MRTTFLALIVASVLFGCPQPAVSPNPTPAPDTDLCGQMCDHLQKLGCAEGADVYDSDLPPAPGKEPGDANESCKDFCEKQQNNGIYINPRCVLQAKSCDEIEDQRLQTCK